MKTAKILFGLIALIAFGCGSEEHHGEAVKMDPVQVTVATASAKQLGAFINASGKIEAQKSANLSTRMMGHVSKLHVKVGEQVKKGDLLLAINNADLYAKKSQVEAGIRQAESALSNAEKDYKRFKTLFEKGSASEKELDDMTTRYEMAKAGLESAQQMKKEVDAQFTYANIRAPFDGVVINTFIKEGDMANPGMPLVKVEGVEKFEATVFVSESEISDVKQGAEVSLFIKSIQKQLKGQVKEVSLSAKNTGGQYLVKIDLPAMEGEVLPGMFVNAQIFQSSPDSQSGVLMIPESALVRKGQLRGIYTVTEDKRALLRWLRTGKSTEGMIEVLSGLSAGETFVTQAKGKIFNGAPLAL